MSKKQLDELLGLENFSPLKSLKDIKGGDACLHSESGNTRVTICLSGTRTVIVRE